MKGETARWSGAAILAAVGILAIVIAVAFGLWATIDEIRREPAGERRQDIGDAIGLWAQSGRGGDRLDLAGLAPFPWERAVVFDSYAPRERAQQALGFDWNIDDSPTSTRDVGSLIGFAEGNRIVAWAVIPPYARFEVANEGDAIVVPRSQPEVMWTGASFIAPP